MLYRTLAGRFVLGRGYSKAMKVQRIIREPHAGVLQGVDFLVMPTAPVAAPRIDAATIRLAGAEHRGKEPWSSLILRNTGPSNTTGLPTITVPCGFTEDSLSIGLLLIGRPFEEALLFQVAHGYEAVSPDFYHLALVPHRGMTTEASNVDAALQPRQAWPGLRPHGPLGSPPLVR